MKVKQKFAIRYSNGHFHNWDDYGEYIFVKNIDEAHLVFNREAANSIAYQIRRVYGMGCRIVEVTYGYQYIGYLGKRSK